MMQTTTEQEKPTLDDTLVSDFLRQNPLFFERNAHLLTELYLPSPHGQGTISLTERQQLAQRDKIRVSENMLAELIEHAKQNDATTQKIHRLSIALLSHPHLAQISEIVSKSMVEIFKVDHAELHCWLHAEEENVANHPIFAPVSEVFHQWIGGLEQPYCGAKPDGLTLTLDKTFASFAFIPLYTHMAKNVEDNSHLPAMGALILASKDADHFNPTMGTVFLSRIGDLLSAALANARE